MATDGGRIGLVEQCPEHGEVVLLIVDRVLWTRRRRPGQRGVTRIARRPLELLVVRDASGRRTHDVERVERRHAGTRFTQLDPWIRDVQTLGCCAGGNLQQLTFGVETLVLRRQRTIHFPPQVVQHQRVLARLLREHPLGEPGHEHDREAAAARLLRRADEHASVARAGGSASSNNRRSAQHAAGFVQIDRPHLRHRPQIGEHAQHVRRRAQHARDQRVEEIEPRAPQRLGAATTPASR